MYMQDIYTYSDRRLKQVRKAEVLLSLFNYKRKHMQIRENLAYTPERAAVISGKPEAVAPLVSLSPDGRSGRV